MDFGKTRILCNLVYIITAFGPLVNAECTSGAELLVNGKTWPSSDIPLYKLLGSNGAFVRCQRCDDSGQPSWFDSNDNNIRRCNNKISQLICVDRFDGGIRDLKFLNFTRSQVGMYTCKHSNDVNSIIVNALSLHPTDQLTSNKMAAKPLNCETTGRGSITYQWQTSNISGVQWMNISNSNSSTLVVGTLEQSQQYRCVVSNEAGSTRSNVATVTVLEIITHPQGKEVALNSRVTLMCRSSISSDVTFSWTHNGSAINGRSTADDTSTLTISSVQYNSAGAYVCTVRSGSVSIMSNSATVTVYGPPIIMMHPNDEVIAVNTSVTLNCKGTGKRPITYQWQSKPINRNVWMNIRKSNNQKLVVMSLQQSQQYRCVVSNEAGSNTSNIATVTVLKITTHPQSKLVPINSTLNLMCISSLSSNVMFSWTHNGTSISGSSTAGDTNVLTISNMQYNNAGAYVCTVRSGSVSVISNSTTVTVFGSPIIMTHPSDELITMSMSVTLNCQGAGGGSITYQWENKRVNQEKWRTISNRNITTLVVNTLEQSRQYRCVVSNEAGTTRSNVATVTVLSISNQPMSHTVIALNDATLNCATPVDGARYLWRRVNGMIPSRSQGRRSSTLTIPKAIPPDEGMYYCIISKDTVTVESDRATLEVNDLLAINVTPTNSVVGEGGMARFIATAGGINRNNFSYQWKKRRNKNLPNKVSGADGAILTIPNLLKSDEGQYYCIVTNEWDNSVESDDVSLAVRAGPLLIQRHPQDQFINNRQTATFKCFVNGSNSALNVTWERNSKQYNSENVENTVHSNGVRSILTINTATVSNDGKYRCRATNADGESSISNEADLIIIPRINNNLNDITVLIGQSSQLACRAQGTSIVYSWIKNNISVLDTNSRILRITNITESDEGVYKCVASNKGGRVESNAATVTVYGPPMVKNVPQQLHAVLHTEFQIVCTATNDQDAPMNMTLSWTAPNGVDITKNDKYDGLTGTSTFHISNVTYKHSGIYRCIASNGRRQGNNISISFTLVTEEKSSPPINFNIFTINATSFRLMWSSPRNPNGIINYYIVYYSNSSHNLSIQVVNNTNFNGTYILTNLRPYTEYNTYVTAVRLIGGGDSRPLEGVKSVMLIERTFAGEPEIIDLEENQIISEITINLNNSVASTKSTFVIDMPQISMKNGPFSHLYIIVIINNSAINATVLSTQKLLNHSKSNPMLLYIAAVVNASQYMQYPNTYRMRYILGAGDNTTDADGHMFHNKEVKKEYSFFYRVFSVNSTLENEIYTDTEIKPVAAPQQSTGDSSSGGSSAAGPVVGVIVALLIIITVIVIVILLLFYYKKKYLEPKKAASSNVVTTDIQLNNKEVKDEDAKPLPPVAATKPCPPETSFTPNSPLTMEVTTSVGQPTTLFIELPYADDSEITWQKDGKSVSHPVLPDGSLYIANTKLTDQGDYTVTAAATDSTTSEGLKLTVIDPKMPTTLSDHKPVKVEDFPEHIALMQSNKNIQFEEDYESVMVDVATSQHAAKLHVNGSKNRYKNIIPYDHSRVVLTQQGGKPGSDYVNASFIDGYKEPKAYIASQGPVSNTVNDFWRMIWECDVTTIVMLTRLIEDSKIKCHQYWPKSKSAEYGNFKVTVTKEEVIAKYCIRKFIIEKTSDSKSREVCQFHYTAWPDHGVPKYGTDILEFQTRIDKYHKRKENKPMLVHCSAGVGRTGTFIAIDTEIQRINHESLVDVFNCVCRLRFWRNFMVQTVDQYTLIFTALLEFIACGDTSIAAPTKSVQDKVKELSTVDPSTNKTGFESQFETLAKNSPKDKEFTYTFATSSKNKRKNRNKKCIPPDTSRVCLSKAGSESDYINACYIDGYRRCKEFLVEPGPMESTCADFWRMIWEKQSHAIVMLGQLKENGEEASWKYWPNKDDKCEFESLTIQTTSEDVVDSNIMKRVMKITHKETSATKTITQLQYVEWSPNVVPSNATSIIDLIETLERVQRKTGNGPITVHCSDGMGRSGTFCALVVSINRFKVEQMVDVFKTIITMRTQRPGLVANAEQYKFIHEAIITLCQRFANYCNFSNDNVTTNAVYENFSTSSK